MAKLINRAAVKKRALELAAMGRPGRFTRVSKSFLDAADDAMENYLLRYISTHPTSGKTLTTHVG